MRTIKFRVLDTLSNKIYRTQEEVMALEDFEREERGSIGLMNAITGECKGKFSNIKYLKFTGLLDKNGKEIYEGDVVEWQFADSDEAEKTTVNCEVKWFDFAWHIYSKDDEYGEAMSELNSDDLEVLGNIYSNPELLKS